MCWPSPCSASTASVTGHSPLTTLRLTVEYDGTNFSGFQWQPNERTVAGTLESALSQLLGGPHKVAVAGRTDAGVHATGQVCSLVTTSAFGFERLATALNAILPGDLSIREAAVAGDGFSARFSARERTYVYAILNRPVRSPLLARYAWHQPQPLDLAAMREAAAGLIGEHDFRSFCIPPEPGPAGVPASTVRRVERLTIESRGELVRVAITANAFLYRMVRSIVGLLTDCGRGRRGPGEIGAVLGARDRSAAGPVAPPQGLYLAGVRYEDGYDSYAEPGVFGAPGLLDAVRGFP